MKQARCWLLLVAALSLLPQAAFAQPRKPGAKPAAPAKPATTAAPTTPAPGGDIEIDDPNTPKAPDQPVPDATPPATGAADAGGGICEIDPTACPKTGDVKKLADRPVKADVYAVQQIYALRRGRFELNPYWAQSLNDQFITHGGPGLS